MEYRIAWLAGLLDGEGSIGIAIAHTPDRPLRPYSFSTSVQMSSTCMETINASIAALAEIAIVTVGYTYQERDPARHLDAHYLQISRLVDIAGLARAVLPYAVTKRRHWQLMAAYATSRLDGATIDSRGRVHRGGSPLRSYSDREIEIAQALHRLNLRGPAAIARGETWHHNASTLAPNGRVVVPSRSSLTG